MSSDECAGILLKAKLQYHRKLVCIIHKQKYTTTFVTTLRLYDRWCLLVVKTGLTLNVYPSVLLFKFICCDVINKSSRFTPL